MVRLVCVVVAVVACGLVPRRAAAQDVVEPSAAPPSQADLLPDHPGHFEPVPPPFGAPGEIAISGTSQLGASYTRFGGSQASWLSLAFGPAVDVFVARNVSIGVSALIAYSDDRGYGADSSLIDSATTNFSAAARLGVNVPIIGALSFWPRVLVGFEWLQESQRVVNGSTISVANPLGSPTTTRDGPWAELVLPLTLHVTPHLFTGIGPSLFHELARAQGADVGGERTTIGAFVDVGGWFGGHDTPVDADVVGEEAAPVRPFGSAHDFVISNAVELQGFWTGYEGTSSTASTLSFTPGVDFFVAEHLSVGITLSALYSHGTGTDSTTGAAVGYSEHSFGIAPRIGADLPLGTYASLWPTFSVGFGKGSYTEIEAGSSDNDNDSYIWVSLYAPVLVHLASHFFVGFGPSVSQDLSHPVTYPSSSSTVQNKQTNVGAGLTVGGTL